MKLCTDLADEHSGVSLVSCSKLGENCVDSGNPNVCLTERGTSFGYNTLVTDMRGLPRMAQDTGCPIIFDATHSVQQPGGQGGSSGGQREYAPVLARAAIAVGVAAVFIETHENPDKALSDGPNTIALKDMPNLLETLKKFDEVRKSLDLFRVVADNNSKVA